MAHPHTTSSFARRATRRALAALLAVTLAASSCADDEPPADTTAPPATAPAATTPATPAPPTATPATTTTVLVGEEGPAEIQDDIAEVIADALPDDVPPDEIAEQVIAAANEAAPDSELTLGDCTEWVADPDIVLYDQQTAECSAMLAAAVEACEGLDCFGEDDGTETEAAPVTTLPPEPEPPTTTTAPPAPTTTAPPAPTTTAPPAPTTTAPPAPTTTAPPAPTATTTVPPEPESEVVLIGEWVPPEAGMVPVPVPECEEYDPDIWEGSGCTPQSRWGEGEYEPGRRQDVFPRQTPQTRAFWDACISIKEVPCRWFMGAMKWALDYLGAHPSCVIYQYTERVRSGSYIGKIDEYGWHNCATVIDPLVSEPPDHLSHVGHRLSDTGISLAERCRIVLPEDVQLGYEVGHAACDAWAERVEARIADIWSAFSSYPDCYRSYRLARAWMQHHHGVHQQYVGTPGC